MMLQVEKQINQLKHYQDKITEAKKYANFSDICRPIIGKMEKLVYEIKREIQKVKDSYFDDAVEKLDPLDRTVLNGIIESKEGYGETPLPMSELNDYTKAIHGMVNNPDQFFNIEIDKLEPLDEKEKQIHVRVI